uniref:Ribosomal protein L9-2 n=1 Tax=Lotharella vacuolata TaxID=74820 RepID=A0A0H5BGS9_9EUKA|nr:ribosomal protein L9-2 [Lotharella vacuolata]
MIMLFNPDYKSILPVYLIKKPWYLAEGYYKNTYFNKKKNNFFFKNKIIFEKIKNNIVKHFTHMNKFIKCFYIKPNDKIYICEFFRLKIKKKNNFVKKIKFNKMLELKKEKVILNYGKLKYAIYSLIKEYRKCFFKKCLFCVIYLHKKPINR